MTRKTPSRPDDYMSRPRGRHAEYLTPGDPDYGHIARKGGAPSDHDGHPGSGKDRWEEKSEAIADWLEEEHAQAARADGAAPAPPHAPARQSDSWVLQRVCERIAGEPGLDASGLDVTVRSGEVFLRGHVPTRSARQRAETLCTRTPGVVRVHNGLQLRPPEDGAAG